MRLSGASLQQEDWLALGRSWCAVAWWPSGATRVACCSFTRRCDVPPNTLARVWDNTEVQATPPSFNAPNCRASTWIVYSRPLADIAPYKRQQLLLPSSIAPCISPEAREYTIGDSTPPPSICPSRPGREADAPTRTDRIRSPPSPGW
ncbi:hypothetical protein BC834DRAFT_333508 [Gloeopeniophorella convolvens]|nr:hypothetical protein BC834DRAFT_333508 [Gloeopeniophorella convolvens]